MKLLYLLTLLASTVSALDLATSPAEALHLLPRQRENELRREPRQSTRPSAFSRVAVASVVAARKPRDAPERYICALGRAERKRSKDALKLLPAKFAILRKREQQYQAQRRALLKLRQGGADFYECPPANPAPKLSDCTVVTDQVYNTAQTLVLNEGACLTFSYQTCKGFFCSLCTTLSVSTDFIGNQLNSAETLCVADGNDASIVSETPPQWEAGFVYETETLPYYDVC